MEKKINRGVIRTGETDIKVHLIDSFPNHPYHVFDDEDMTELAASIEAMITDSRIPMRWFLFFLMMSMVLMLYPQKDSAEITT